MPGDVVDLEGGHDLVAVRTLVGLVPQDLGTERLPLRGPVPAAECIVGPGTFTLGGVEEASPAAGELVAARDAAEVRGLRRHRGSPSDRSRGCRADHLDAGQTGGRRSDRSRAQSGRSLPLPCGA